MSVGPCPTGSLPSPIRPLTVGPELHPPDLLTFSLWQSARGLLNLLSAFLHGAP
ncbi:hypothetical protein KCP76_06020 [Salmonella enterica subsp. enterica serovar Weltevreden]|nr:hypothetical protein KCP76_06020 [Salmonella enterica subsp. enterica serovar Weltevreden]